MQENSKKGLSLWVKVLLWNIVIFPVSITIMILFALANPMTTEQGVVFMAIWLLVTFFLATGLGYNIHNPKTNDELGFPEGSNHVTVGPIFEDEEEYDINR